MKRKYKRDLNELGPLERIRYKRDNNIPLSNEEGMLLAIAKEKYAKKERERKKQYEIQEDSKLNHTEPSNGPWAAIVWNYGEHCDQFEVKHVIVFPSFAMADSYCVQYDGEGYAQPAPVKE